MLSFAELLIYLLVPLAVPGPVAAFVLNSAAKKKKLSVFHSFWLLIINVLSLILMLVTLGHSWFGPGDVALCATPLGIAASVQILHSSRKEILELIDDDSHQQKYYAVARISIPILQLLIMLLGLAFTAFSE